MHPFSAFWHTLSAWRYRIARLPRSVSVRLEWELCYGGWSPGTGGRRRIFTHILRHSLRDLAFMCCATSGGPLREEALRTYHREIAFFRKAHLPFKRRWEDPKVFLRAMGYDPLTGRPLTPPR